MEQSQSSASSTTQKMSFKAQLILGFIQVFNYVMLVPLLIICGKILQIGKLLLYSRYSILFFVHNGLMFVFIFNGCVEIIKQMDQTDTKMKDIQQCSILFLVS